MRSPGCFCRHRTWCPAPSGWASGELLQGGFETLPAGLVGRQAETQAGRLSEVANENAPPGQKRVQFRSARRADPLEQRAAATRRPAVVAKQRRQPVAL